MISEKISDTDEVLIQSNVELCLKNEALKRTISELEKSLKTANDYNDMICGIARKMAITTNVVNIRNAKNG